MAEDAQRCRFWPDCLIHTGLQRLQADVGGREREQIRQAVRAGVRPTDIADRHGLTARQVYRIGKGASCSAPPRQ